MTEEKIQQFLTWLLECEAKEEYMSVNLSDYSWNNRGKLETYTYIKEMFKTAFREELE